jgi:phage shock protein PspC (stress-responsive transcriptional regulator)
MESQSTTAPRLVRRSHGRMIAGVCKGIADHFGVEPVLVRIGFVVASFFGGAGVIGYAAAWLLIPEEGDRTSIGERIFRERRWGRITGFVLIAIAISAVAQPAFWFGGHVLFAVVLIMAGVYLLAPGFSGQDPAPGAPSRPLRTERGTTPPVTDTAPVTAVEGEPPLPPDPPGSAVPDEPSPGARPPRSRLGALTFGLLLVGGGVVGLVLAAGNSVEPSAVFAVGLLIVGAALVLSTWVGRSYILIPLGVVLVALMSASTVIDVPISGGIGERRVQPLTVSELKDEYHLGIGELRIDLSHVAFERGTTRTIKATVGIGDLRVVLPRNVVAELHGHAGAGDIRFLDQDDSGLRVDRDTTLSASGENPARIVLDAEVGAGQVEVTDAAA